MSTTTRLRTRTAHGNRASARRPRPEKGRRLREPLARWLDEQAQYVADSGMDDVLVVDIARAVNSTGEPGPGEDAHVADRLSARSRYEQRRLAAGETP